MMPQINADSVRPFLPDLDKIALDFYGINFERDQEHCPFPGNHNHGDRDKSLRFDRGKGRIFCASQHCFGESGVDAFGLVQKMESVSFPQALEKLADRYGATRTNPPADSARSKQQQKAARPFDEIRRQLERDGFFATDEHYFGDDLRKVRFEHEAKVQEEKNRPEKTFRWEYCDGDSWFSGTANRTIPLYLNRAARERDQIETMVGVEGPAKADALDRFDIPAFSFKELCEENAAPLANVPRIVLWRDKDEQGIKLCGTAIGLIAAHNVSIAVVEPPEELPHSGDVVDAIALGWTGERFWAAIGAAKVAPGLPARAIQRIEDLKPMSTFGNTEVVMVLEQAFAEGTVIVVTSEPGAGKSSFISNACYCISKGLSFAGRKTSQRAVLFIDGEDPISSMSAMHDRLGICEHDAFRVWGLWQQEEPPQPDSAIVLDYIERCNPKPIIVLNPLVAFWGGDENDAKQTRAFMSRLRKIAAMGATIIGIHHIGKSESSKDFRGSSDLKAAIDLGLKVNNTSETPGRLDRVTVSAFKDRMGIFTEMKLRYATGGFVADQFAPSLTNTDRLVELLRKNPGVQKVAFLELAKSEGLGRNRAESFLESGARSGLVLVENGVRNSRLFSLSQEAS